MTRSISENKTALDNQRSLMPIKRVLVLIINKYECFVVLPKYFLYVGKILHSQMQNIALRNAIICIACCNILLKAWQRVVPPFPLWRIEGKYEFRLFYDILSPSGRS